MLLDRWPDLAGIGQQAVAVGLGLAEQSFGRIDVIQMKIMKILNVVVKL